MTKPSLGEEMYQDPKEAEKHFRDQGKDFQRYANDILGFLPIKSGKLLDVGCGFGWVVSEAEKRGFKAIGIDQAKPYVELGRQVLHVDLVYTSLENYTTKEKFDVVILNHVLEHIKRPNEFLTRVRNWLQPKGILFVACPNINSLMYWIFRDRWYGLQPAQHVWQFTPKSLSALLRENNFEIEKVIVNGLDYQPKRWKKIAFWALTNLANWLYLGDQAIVLARKK